jgi:YXWGXW repeat-containing protein
MRMILSIRSLLLAVMMLAIPVKSSAEIILSITIAPPPLPIYEQALCPGDGYIWTPGFWAYGDDGFFWVPGTWVLAPAPGLLWTPGYWGWADGLFVFNQGYWGPHVGFYGGINYGFGYVGEGYEGGYWDNGAFFYNRSVNNVTNVRNVYNKTVIVNNVTVNNVSYNGGAGGIPARPTSEEQAALRERHVPPIPAQTQHLQAASTNRQLYESVNHGKPPIAATARPADFKGHGAVAAKAAAQSYAPPTARTVAPSVSGNSRSRSVAPIHPSDLPAPARPSMSNTGGPMPDRKSQQEQEKLFAKQEQERQKLQQKQQQEHQRIAQSRPEDPKKQQIEQKHQQETRQLEQRQAKEQQKFQDKQRPSNPKPR